LEDRGSTFSEGDAEQAEGQTKGHKKRNKEMGGHILREKVVESTEGLHPTTKEIARGKVGEL